jgi:hypothetical protein
MARNFMARLSPGPAPDPPPALQIGQFPIQPVALEFQRVDLQLVDQVLLDRHAVVLIAQQFPQDRLQRDRQLAAQPGAPRNVIVRRPHAMPHAQQLDETADVVVEILRLLEPQRGMFRGKCADEPAAASARRRRPRPGPPSPDRSCPTP